MALDEGKKKKLLFSVGILFASFLIILGIILICLQPKPKDGIKKNYTECVDHYSPTNKTCESQIRTRKKSRCTCYVPVTIEEPIRQPVYVYYELPGYNQTRDKYTTSRDDAQLAGHLSMEISPKCGNFSYEDPPANTRPIAPCGEIADSMFFDDYTLLFNESLVPTLSTELDGITEEDKKLYRNPPGDLEEAFKNFSKPISWLINVTSLDGTTNTTNNGFQNERFIAWMKTDMKRKPAFRIKPDGMFEHELPANNYKFRVSYFASNYVTGPRIVIINNVETVASIGQLIAGIIILLLGICASGVLVYYITVGKFYIPVFHETEPATSTDATNVALKSDYTAS